MHDDAGQDWHRQDGYLYGHNDGDGDAGAIPVAVAVIPVMTLMVGGDGYCNV